MKKIFIVLFCCLPVFVFGQAPNANTVVFTSEGRTSKDTVSIYKIVDRSNDTSMICGVNYLYVDGFLIGEDTLMCSPKPCCDEELFLCKDSTNFWIDTLIVSSEITRYTIYKRSKLDCTIEEVQFEICKPPLPALSRLNGFSSSGIVTISNENKNQEGNFIACGECGRLEVYIDYGNGFRHHETIKGNNGSTVSSYSSTVHNEPIESMLNYIAPNDVVFNCIGTGPFDLNAEAFTKNLADSLNLCNDVKFRLYTYIGGQDCSTPPTEPSHLEESVNTDNFYEFSQSVLLEKTLTESVIGSTVDTVTFTNIAVFSVGDSTTKKIRFDHSNDLSFTIYSADWCMMPNPVTQLANVVATSRLSTQTSCNAIGSTNDTASFTVVFEKEIPCFQFKLEDFDASSSGLRTEAIYDISPAAISLEPITNSEPSDLKVFTNDFGQIVSIEPLTTDNNMWLTFENTDKISFKVYRRTNSNINLGEIRFCN